MPSRSLETEDPNGEWSLSNFRVKFAASGFRGPHDIHDVALCRLRFWHRQRLAGWGMRTGASRAPAWVVDYPSAGRYGSVADDRSNNPGRVLRLHRCRCESYTHAGNWVRSCHLDVSDGVWSQLVHCGHSDDAVVRYDL